jgi:hypothetical protein
MFFELSKVGTATGPVLHLDVYGRQEPFLLLDNSHLQGLDELNLDNRSLCSSWTCLHQGQELHLEISTLQRPALHLNVYI